MTTTKNRIKTAMELTDATILCMEGLRSYIAEYVNKSHSHLVEYGLDHLEHLNYQLNCDLDAITTQINKSP